MFADFIKIAERVYFYENIKNGNIYSSSSYTSGENGFHIKDPLERVEKIADIFSTFRNPDKETVLNSTPMIKLLYLK